MNETMSITASTLKPSNILSLAIRQLLNRLTSEHFTSFALYGAGKHTQRFLEEWRILGNSAPSITCILDDHAEGTIHGIPIVPPTACVEYTPETVVISSDTFESHLYRKALGYGLTVPIIRLYADNHLASTQAEEQWVDIPTIKGTVRVTDKCNSACAFCVCQAHR